MMVACSVIAIVMVSITGIFEIAGTQWNSQVGFSAAMQEANLAADLMSKEIGTGMQWSSSNYLVLPANTDASGNFIPSSNGSSTVVYAAGTAVQYYLSNTNGTAGSGTYLWRRTNTGLFGSWVPDTTWSFQPGSTTMPRYPNVSALSFSNPNNTNLVQLSVTVSYPENGKTYSYTATRNVFLTYHN
jgi:hypothetical protein